MILKTFGWSFAFTVVGLAAAFFYGFQHNGSVGAGLSALSIAGILIVLEVSLSFDNAVVNAKVLNRMSAFWQKIFLTIGILIAVFGMRLVFPFLVVWATAGLNPARAWDLAMKGGSPETEGTYGYYLEHAHALIAAFGGMFLLLIFLDFFFDQSKERHWLDPIESRMETLGHLEGASIILSLGLLLGSAYFLVPEQMGGVLASGILGMLTYLIVKGLGDLFERRSGIGDTDDPEALENTPGARVEEVNGTKVVKVAGKAAFFMFIYLEVLDASFSFDGVIGAFAITTDPIVIALGLGVGALYVRSLTVFLVRKGTLSEYVYLEHGAHWAIGALAVLLFVSMKFSIPEVVTGLIGVAFILSSLWWSIRENKRDPEAHEVHV